MFVSRTLKTFNVKIVNKYLTVKKSLDTMKLINECFDF